MTDKQFVKAYEYIQPDEEAKARMLSNILAAQKDLCEPSAKKNHTPAFRILPTVCAAAAILCILAVPQFQSPVQPNNQLVVVQSNDDSPNGVRKVMNYGGFRYVFLQNGAAYDLEPSDLSDVLGTLQYDIQQNPKSYSSTEFAASFAVGGTVYQLSDYDPQFRLAVRWENQYYIAECVDTLDNTDMDLNAYFKAADFADNVTEIRICDHTGQNLLEILTEKDAKDMVSALAQATPADLTNAQYEEIAHAQRNGASYCLVFRLKDGTDCKMYMIPSLSLVSLGDNYYHLSDGLSDSFQWVFPTVAPQAMPAG